MKKILIVAFIATASLGVTACQHMDTRYSGSVNYSWGDGYYDYYNYPGYWGYSGYRYYPRYPRRYYHHHHHRWY